MRTIRTFFVTLTLFLFGVSVLSASQEDSFQVYVEDIWEHKVIIVGKAVVSASHYPNISKVREKMLGSDELKKEMDEEAKFACELYDRISVPLSTWRNDDVVKSLYACATEDPY